MKKIYFSLLVLAMTLVSTVAKAQFEGLIEMYPASNYNTKSVDFSLSDVAFNLDTDTATLRQAIENWTSEYTPVSVGDITNLIDEYLVGAEGVTVETITNLIDEYLNGNNAGKAIIYIGANKAGGETPDLYTANGFGSSWMNMAGDVCAWGDTEVTEEGDTVGAAKVFNDFAIDAANNIFQIKLGQYPDRLVADDFWAGIFTLVYGEKEVTFTVRLQIVEQPAVEVLLSKLEIVGNYEMPLEFTVGKSYEGKTYSTTLEGIYEALGTTAEDLDADVANFTYTQVVQSDSVEGDAVYSWADALQKPEDAAGGSWFGRYANYNEETGEETIFGNAPKAWNTGSNTFYTQSITLNNGEFSIVSGQFPDVLKAGDSDYANLYIINGSKAVCVKVYTVVKEPGAIDPNEMILIGDTVIAVKADIDNSYAQKPFTVDVEAIAAALECSVNELEVLSWGSEGSMSDNSTANNGGFWFTEDGFITNWGDNSAFFIEPASNGDFSNLGVGQYPNYFADLEGEKTVKAQIIFQNGQKYFTVTVEYTIKGKEPKPEEFTYNLVATESLSIQIVPNNEGVWLWETTTTLDMDYIASKIGTDDFKLYTDKADADGNLTWSDNYTCTPAPGFWYGVQTYENEEHQVVVDNAGWGTNSFGITYASGVISWYQYPGQRSAGDAYQANLYLTNEETGDYIKYILNVKYVDEVMPEAEFAGQEEVTVQMSNDLYDDDEGAYIISINMEAAYDSLGISEELIEACAVIAPKSSTMYNSYPTEEQIFYNADGYTVSDDDESAIMAVAVVINEEGKPVLYIDDFSGYFDQEDATATVRIGLEYDGKRYLHIITLTNKVPEPNE